MADRAAVDAGEDVRLGQPTRSPGACSPRRADPIRLPRQGATDFRYIRIRGVPEIVAHTVKGLPVMKSFMARGSRSALHLMTLGGLLTLGGLALVLVGVVANVVVRARHDRQTAALAAETAVISSV